MGTMTPVVSGTTSNISADHGRAGNSPYFGVGASPKVRLQGEEPGEVFEKKWLFSQAFEGGLHWKIGAERH